MIEADDYEKSDHIFVIGEVLKNHVISLINSKDKITNLGQGVNIDLYQRQHEKPDDF